jgi:hypothetical protein
VDIGRIYIATSQMQAAVDAAALAGANAFDNTSSTDPSGRRNQVIAYYRDNFRDDFLGVQVASDVTPLSPSRTLLEPNFTTVNGISQTEVSAVGMLPMTLMTVFGNHQQRISVTAHAQFQPHPLEVMVVLDNTGSMSESAGGQPKINSLKTAMHSFLNVLYQGADSQPELAIGIINYTIAANVGSILSHFNVPVEPLTGFTDGAPWMDGSSPMSWKGCVANDETVPDLSSNLAIREADAHDLWNSLPEERPRPSSLATMKPIKPFLYPPAFLPTTAGASASDPASEFYLPTGNVNLFPASADLAAVANSATYKRYFYRLYIGLNNGAANMGDDVIIQGSASAPSYYDPTVTSAFNPVTNVGADFTVRTDKIPRLDRWKAARGYSVSSNNTAMPSPNWQCPQPGRWIEYGVRKQVFDDFVDKQVWAVQPANGTMHHTGFIWGWRLLSRYDVFRRTPPVGAAAPVRALVFMTDGETALNVGNGQYDRVSTAYGTVVDGKLTARTSRDSTTRNAFVAQADLRFAKACAIANSTAFADSGKPPQIYVVAINGSNDIDNTSQGRLRNCGASGYWLTTTPNDLNTAFAQIARTLIDVHLTR